MSRYILKEELNGQPVYDGIIAGIGEVRHGQPVTPYSPEQEQLLKADPRFKQYRETATAEEPAPTPETKTTTKKTADSGKEG